MGYTGGTRGASRKSRFSEAISPLWKRFLSETRNVLNLESINTRTMPQGHGCTEGKRCAQLLDDPCSILPIISFSPEKFFLRSLVRGIRYFFKLPKRILYRFYLAESGGKGRTHDFSFEPEGGGRKEQENRESCSSESAPTVRLEPCLQDMDAPKARITPCSTP